MPALLIADIDVRDPETYARYRTRRTRRSSGSSAGAISPSAAPCAFSRATGYLAAP